MPILLVIDDEPAILHAFRRAFREPDVTVLTASSSAEGLARVAECQPDVVILDIHLPDLSGMQTFQRLHRLDARIPVVFITGHGTTDTAIEAIKLGAYDYLLKPLELPQIRAVVARAFEIHRLMHVPAVLAEEEPAAATADVLVGRCPAMQAVYKAIGRVASQDVTVLLLGESGTGKELVARALYQHSGRATGPFLAINCAAIPETLLESELFGHEKGAFTGAERTRIGKFEQCAGGTLFLDEVGAMTPLTQTKLLRLIQERQFERVGGNQVLRTDVRLIAATNSDLEELTARGQFRRDLFYRLSVFTIRLPPLRERNGDMPLLIDHFVRRFTRELGKDVQHVPVETIALAEQYPWPGNVRELQSVLKQALLHATGPVLVPDFLPASVRRQVHNGQPVPFADSALERFVHERLHAGSSDLYAEALALMERQVLASVLRHTHGNQLQAAKFLGITRGSLRTKLRGLGITIGRSVALEEDAEPGV
jgi:two-component system nitrogen regulation response regulator GlnG